MHFPIPEGLRQDPLDSFPSACQSLQGYTILCPYQSFVIRVPVELEPFLFEQVGGDLKLDFEPVG